ncbi:MAG: alpha-2-macroglobulin, partial [Anaerolineales bacterium]
RDDYRSNQQHVMVVSDINLTLKVGPDEGLVWATRLDTGEPVPNLNLNVLELYGSFTADISTDRQGIARFSIPENHNTLLVTSAVPFAAVSDQWSMGISPWDFNVGDGVYGQDYRTYITTDRPIYRPGQEVNFKGIIRAEDDAAFAPSGIRKVMVMIRDAAYEEIYNEELTVNSMGSFEGKLLLEDGASLGQYFITVNIADNYAEIAFQVAAYRPPEFEVVVALDEAEVQRGNDIKATISTAYYFGGGLGETVVRWNVTAERYSFTTPWGGRYSFDDVDDPYVCYRCWWWWWPDSVNTSPILEGAGTTDANGSLEITLDGRILSEALQKGARRITLEAVATGPDNQEIAGRSVLVVHPGVFYTGLSARQYVSNAGEESDIDVVVVDWAGQRLPDQEIKVSFYHFTWENTFIENANGGGRWDWETKETLVEEVVVRSDKLGEAVATFVPPKGGSYHVVAQPANLTPETEAIRTSIFIWVAGKDQVSWRRENNDRITLVSDKTAYQVGDIAEILIPSPFDGPHMALVTVEREGIRRHEVIRLVNNSTIYRLLIEEGDIPNIFVSVVLVKARTSTDPASYKMGLLPLDVDLAPKTLHVEVVPGTETAEPGQDVIFTLIATGPDGQPATGAELSFDIVDKAVLSLRPRTANILDTLYARRALQVGTASGLTLSINRYMEQITEDLAREVAAQGVRGLGGGNDEMGDLAYAELDGAEMPMAAPSEQVMKSAEAENIAPPAGVEIREEFADTAFWAPQLLTDAQGKVSVSVTLPDNLTTWTARGVGLTVDTIVGEGTSDLIATKPLLIRPVAPRFFVVDDRAQLAANVSNNTARTLTVDVSLSAEGIGISAETPPLQSVTIPANSERKVTWWVTVDDVVQAELVFGAVSGTFTDASKP